MNSKNNQLSRYGAITRAYPSNVGKVFFLYNLTESKISDVMTDFPNDNAGVPRVYSTWAAVIAALTYGDIIIVSPQFKTVPTITQIIQMEQAQAIAIMGGLVDAYGTHYATTNGTLNLPQTTSSGIFTVSGKVLLTGLVGTITTAIGATANNASVVMQPTVGSITTVAQTVAIGSATVGEKLTFSGTIGANLVLTNNGAYTDMLQNIILDAGILAILTSANDTGTIKWKAQYVPLEPGAFMW